MIDMKKSKFIVLLLLFCLQPGFLAAQRAEAIRKMQAALCEMVIEGVEINRELQLETIASKEFTDGTYTTDFLNRLLKQLY